VLCNFPTSLPFFTLFASFVRETHTPRMAHSAGWGRRISYVWAITQVRQPVSFVIVHIPLRGEWTLNENKTNKQTNRTVHSDSTTAIARSSHTGAGPGKTKACKVRNMEC
jgi:hypothetical protein